MSSSPTEQTVEVTLPELAGDVLEAIVVGWEKHPGDWVDTDEPICIVSADGLRAAVASSASGYLVRLLAGVGARIGAGTSLAEIATVDPSGGAKPAEGVKPEADPVNESPAADEITTEPEPDAEDEPEPEPVEQEGEPEPEPEPVEPEGESETESGLEPNRMVELEEFFSPLGQGRSLGPPAPEHTAMSSFHSPAVRRLAAAHGIDLTIVPGNGIGGRVRKEDLLAYIDDLDGAVADASIAADVQGAGST